MACDVKGWYEEPKERIRAPRIMEWGIDDPESNRKVGVGLAVSENDESKYEVHFFSGSFPRRDPILGVFDTAKEAMAFAKKFMKEVDTWNKLKEYFDEHYQTDMWESLYY